jgi:hypothetical protein
MALWAEGESEMDDLRKRSRNQFNGADVTPSAERLSVFTADTQK